ncbi:hypothetical protein ABFU82_02215 [Nocardioides sp. WV_118_6]|uniref:hypothetical protein n=1 Tax=Pimelobacter TaxID=2044 RepID=UPI001C0430F0|nr:MULTISPECIES: hypothetical protein [Pimelobacter]MBU2697062.1 hypothetical protein [Pimelobacter sp. 30-1]UUW87145.1 hypothetical protein M0M43_15475 [Pimelobacter simplex]UUW96651.1 hypothetical protein M0M48_04110 [Pimelobacter simplex]
MSGPAAYDASEGAAEHPSLAALETRAAEDALRAALDRVREDLDAMAERERDEPLDPGVAAVLERIAGAPDAPLEYRSIHARVGRGTLTWAGLWHDPDHEGSAGRRLVLDAVRVLAAEVVMPAPEGTAER